MKLSCKLVVVIPLLILVGCSKPNIPDTQELFSYLGRSHSDPSVQSLLNRLGKSPVVDKNDKFSLYCYPKHGVVIFFLLEGNHISMVQLYGGYQGQLPDGLSFSDTRADVRRKLGVPDSVDISGRDFYKSKKLAIDYKSPEGNNRQGTINDRDLMSAINYNDGALLSFSSPAPQPSRVSENSKAWQDGYRAGLFHGKLDRDYAQTKFMAPDDLEKMDIANSYGRYTVGTEEYGDFWTGYRKGYFAAR